MESGIRVLLLTAAALLIALPCAAVKAAEPQDSGRAGGDAPQQDAPADDNPPHVIEPEVERRKVPVPGIHSSNIEIGLHYGALSIEDFGVNPSYGASIAYHASEDVFFRGDIGRSTAGLTSAETLANVPVLTGSRHFTYYDLAFGYNFLPGEAFIGRGTALVSSFYILAGLGATEFGGDRKLTVVYGGGYQVLPANWLAVHVEVENHMFESNVLGFSKLTNNIEARLVTSFFF
jgi:outer membrane beta-barrel protein